MVFNRGSFAPNGDIWHWLKTFLVVITGSRSGNGVGVMLASSSWRPRKLLNIWQCTGWLSPLNSYPAPSISSAEVEDPSHKINAWKCLLKYVILKYQRKFQFYWSSSENGSASLILVSLLLRCDTFKYTLIGILVVWNYLKLKQRCF